MTRDEFTKALRPLIGFCVDDATDEVVNAYWYGLQDLTADQLRYAVERFIYGEDSRRLPSIAWLRSVGAELVTGRRPEAGEAWNQIITLSRHGVRHRKSEGYAKLDPLTREALKNTGGWDAVCDATADTLSIVASQFRRNYEALVRREREMQTLPERLRPTIGPPQEARNVAAALGRRQGIKASGSEKESGHGDD